LATINSIDSRQSSPEPQPQPVDHAILESLFNIGTNSYRTLADSLKKYQDQVMKEKQVWEAEKAMIKAQEKQDDELIKLNVQGQIFMLRRSLLCSVPGSVFEAKFSGRHEIKVDEEGCVFMDIDSEVFTWIVRYLNRKCVVPQIETRYVGEDFIQELGIQKLFTHKSLA